MEWNRGPTQIKNRKLYLVRILIALLMLTGLWLLVRSVAPNAEKVEFTVQTAAISGQTVATPNTADTTGDINRISTGQVNVKVAIMDTGIDTDHPDLNIAGGVSFVSYTQSWDDDNGHGTHVAGIIRNTLNELGALPQAEFYAVKVINATGKGYISDVVSGINWAMANNMDIIVMTLTTDTNSSKLHKAIDNAYNQGLVLVAAAGNEGYVEGEDTVKYPARYNDVISVGSTDDLNERTTTSSVGAELDVVAHGANIFSTVPGGGYTCKSGTSMAAAQVAGVVAFMKANGVSGNEEIQARLQSTAQDLGTPGRDNFYGWGMVEAEAAAQ